MSYEQWLPCDVVVNADPRVTTITMTTIVEHMVGHLEGEGADVAQLTWSCEVRTEPYPVYAITADD